ncbi:MAG: arylmalonate decarboxylase [Acetobacteraceae bacterium]|nr:arylmalonate decarboxylase [Acetobacteraceae bacterium]NBS42481.1 arylmalonate decarboxylase [Acetobacteraceae bacterium]
MVPSGNAICEAELHAMLPPGVVALITRLELRGSSEAELAKMLNRLEEAAGLLADARPALLGFHCTAVSTFAPDRAAEIPARIAKASGLPAVTTADAILAALGALGAKRILLTTPYIAAVHEREIAFLAAHGCAVMGGDLMGINTNAEMAQIPPEAIAAQARGAARAAPSADACFISCTAIRSAGVIEALEAELGMPVITSNQVMAWHVLRHLGLQDQPQGFGRLMALT